MDTEKFDKSIVFVKVPKRLSGGAKLVKEWREFRLKSKLMPNGYRVTLAAVQTATHYVLGASACSPLDQFGMEHAYNMALGRARQQAFQVEYGKPLFVTLVMGTIPPSRISSGPTPMIHGGIIEDGWGIFLSRPGQLTLKAQSEPVYEVVARNAELMQVIEDLARIDKLHGYRFDLQLSFGRGHSE